MMKELKSHKSGISRRKFIGGTAAAAAITMVPFSVSCQGGATPAPVESGKPNSNFGGVQIGAITYSWRSMPGGVENIIKYCREANISSIELMSGDLETFLGAPQNPMTAIMAAQRQQAAAAPPPPPPPAGTTPPAQQPGARPAGQGAAPAAAQGGGFQRRQLTPEQEAAVAKYGEDLKQWRVSLPEAKVLEAKKLFNDAGIYVHIVKFSPSRWSDEEIDYAFRTAKAMGAKGVTEEIGEEAVKRLAPFAEKHGMYAIFHNHAQFATPGFSYDPFLAVSPAVMMNFDAGHFFGSTGIHPNEMIEKYHERIFSLHIKDKTGPNTEPANTNQVWGQGEVPLKDVLLLIKEKKWPIYCDIELEYQIAPWSNAVKETKTCVEYARQILM